MNQELVPQDNGSWVSNRIAQRGQTVGRHGDTDHPPGEKAVPRTLWVEHETPPCDSAAPQYYTVITCVAGIPPPTS